MARACDSPAGVLQAPRMDRRKGIALTLDEQQRFLEESHTIILSTIDRHGYPHSVAMWSGFARSGSGAGTTGSSAARTAALEEARQLREPLHPLGRDERQLAAELLAVEKDLRRLLEHHGARRGVAHRLPGGHEAVALEDRAAARLERLADGLGKLRRARHEPRYGPRVREEDRIGVDRREGL